MAVSCIEVEDYLLCISIASLGSKCHITELPVSKWKNWSYFQPWGCFHWKPFQFSRCSTQLLTSMLLPLLLAPLSSSFEAVTSAEQRNQKIIIHLPVTELHALFPLWSRHTWFHWKALIIHYMYHMSTFNSREWVEVNGKALHAVYKKLHFYCNSSENLYVSGTTSHVRWDWQNRRVIW